MHKAMDSNTLQYTAPSHGDWGIVRVASLVPESYMLFVCPFACGRHGALGAIDQGYKHKLSYVYIDQADIIEGYDQAIRHHMRELLLLLKETPKAMFVYVSCLDDLIGTDLDALMEELHQEYPHIQFRAGHMNPIKLDSKVPPGMSTQDAMFSFLAKAEKKDRGLNLIGDLVEIPNDCELYDFLRVAGIHTVRHMSNFTTFDAFQSMAKSSYNLALSPIASLASKNMEKKHGTPYVLQPISYNMQTIAQNYKAIATLIAAEDGYDFSQDITKTENKIQEARRILGERGISISAGAVFKPFELAKTLIEYGFRVDSVIAQKALPIDKEGYEWLKNADIDVAIIQPQNPEVIRFDKRNGDVIAIGFDAAYITGSKHIVNLSGDQGMYGYHGVRQLMDMLIEAQNQESDLKKLIQEYGVVV